LNTINLPLCFWIKNPESVTTGEGFFLEKKMEPEVKFAGMKVRKEQRQAMFYIIENCSSCSLDHIVYERDMHTVINSPEDQLVFICPREHTCVLVDNEINNCDQCGGTGEVNTYDCIACNGSGRK
jgi:hypothetical protein